MEAQAETIEQIAETLVAFFRTGGKVILFGNGGSAADAQHIAAELAGAISRLSSSVTSKTLPPYFAETAVFIVPLRAGSGMRVKILDAWARGIPIVSTSIGCEGIEVQHGENILIADTPQTFAQAVVAVIRDRELAQRLAENGRRLVEERYDWRVVYRNLDEVYEEIGK
jgi:glycosyltransferase involved in cell wall biosynthesis